MLKPVVISALKPLLSSDLTEDTTPCPKRALGYYLDRTATKRKGFISFKDGFDKDIQRCTISSWIKQTVILAYQSFESKPDDIHVKAHDISSMAASLAFKGGVSLEQVLGNHNTFTTFYLKDVSWQSTDQTDLQTRPTHQRPMQICIHRKDNSPKPVNHCLTLKGPRSNLASENS